MDNLPMDNLTGNNVPKDDRLKGFGVEIFRSQRIDKEAST